MTDEQSADTTPNWMMIERTFDAPVDIVWQLWTDPEHFRQWYGPTGASIPVAEMDVQVGGRRLICMEMPTPDGPMSMWFTGQYREISENHRLVYTEAMADQDGNVLTPAEMGMPADHPETTEVVVEFEAAGDKTVVTLTHVGVPGDSAGAMGWNMALDKFADHLSQAA